MSDRFFLDTNVFVYAFSMRELQKAETAKQLIRRAMEQRSGIISYQVVQEFCNVAQKQFNAPLATVEIEQYLLSVLKRLLAVHSSIDLCAEALHIRERYKLSWYDSLIVAAAAEAKCSILYTEDLQHDQRFGDLVVQNPFRTESLR